MSHGLALLLCLATACKQSGEAEADPAQESEAPRSTSVSLEPGVYAYVTNEASNDISVIDTSTDTVVKTIFVGKRPRGLRLSADGTRLFVAVSGSPRSPPWVDPETLPPPDREADGIAVVDLDEGKVTRVLESGTDPEAFDISADDGTIYVSNEDAAKASILDVETGKVLAVVPVGGEPEGVTLRPDGEVVYVTSEEENLVYVIDVAERAVIAKVKTGPRPREVVFTSDGTRAFVSAENGAAVTVVDAQRHIPTGSVEIPGEGAKPMGLELSPDEETLFVGNGRGKSVALVDADSLEVSRMIPDVGVRPWGVAITPDGRKLYTANGPSNDVSVIDVKSGEVIERIPSGERPWGVVVGEVRR